MRILAVVSTIDMKFRMGATPAWWQLLKALHEEGHEVIVTPYLGETIEAPWWRTYPNPCQIESEVYNWYLDRAAIRSIGYEKAHKRILSNLSYKVISNYVKPKWHRHLTNICENEKPDALLVLSVPLNHIVGIPSALKAKYSIPVLYYDADLPMSLPEYAEAGAFKFSMYDTANISEYDVFLSCSKGILPRLFELGAKRADYLYFAADPDLFCPVEARKDIDIFYYGHRSAGKERRMDYMLKEPSLAMKDEVFYVGGREFKQSDIGSAKLAGTMPLNVWRTWCNRSRINLNITKEIDASIYGSSSARPFELAAMGCCIVSDKYEGMSEWFNVGSEIWVANDTEHAILIYRTLLADDKLREQTGKAARERVLAEHTYRHRAKRLTRIITSI